MKNQKGNKMKISRWKLVKALGVRILGSTLYFTLMWGVLGVVSLLIYRTVEIGMTGGNVLKFIKDMWIVFFVLISYGVLSIRYSGEVQKGFLLDIILGRVERVLDIYSNTMELHSTYSIFDRRYAKEYWIEIQKTKRNEALKLYVNKNISVLPKGQKYNLYYLKGSKTLVNAEVFGEKKVAVKEEIRMDEPVIPRYDREKIKIITRHQAWRSNVMAVLSIVGGLNLLICRTPLSLFCEVAFVIVFIFVDRGYFIDRYNRQIEVTEPIAVEDIYGKGFLFEGKKIRDKIIGVRLQVVDGIHKNKTYRLYKENSEYWNCFPMCAGYLHRYHGERFQPGEKNIKAVRLYFLKNSRIIVKLDVLTEEKYCYIR